MGPFQPKSLAQRVKIAGRVWPATLLLYSLAVYSLLNLWLEPGLGGDSARLGLHALDFLERGVWPFYIYHTFAPSALIVYLHALAFAVFGVSVATLDGVTLAAGALTSAAAYLACRETFSDWGLITARRAGLIAGLSIPLNLVLNGFAQGGSELVLLPLCALLIVAALWRGLRRGRVLDFALAGAVLGISQYAYIVARALPVALLITLAFTLWLHPSLRRHRRGLLALVLAFSLIALPQWWLFVQAPYALVARSQQSAGRLIFAVRDFWPLLGLKLFNQLQALAWRWPGSGYNPSERPLLNAALVIGLVPAVIAALRTRRPSSVFVTSLTLIMLWVDLMTVEGVWPAPTRMMGALPFLIILAGQGGALTWNWLEARPRWSRLAGRLTLGAVLLAGAESQWDLITRAEPSILAAPGREWMSSLVEWAEAEDIKAHGSEPILIPAVEFQRAPLAFLLAEQYPQRAGALAAPLAPGDPIRVLMPAQPERPTTDGVPARFIEDEWVLLKDGCAYFLPPLAHSLEAIDGPYPLYARNGVLAAQASHARWRASPPEITSASLQFANGLELTGYYHGVLTPGQSLIVTLYWQARRPLADDVQIFVQVLDRHEGYVAGIHDWPLRGTYRAAAWRAGEIMPLSYRFDIPRDLPPGGYRVVAGVFDILHQRRIPLATGQDLAVVARLKNPLAPPPNPPAATAQARFGQDIRLLGYTLAARPGQLEAQLYWQAVQPPDFDYTVFVHAIDTQGKLAGQNDAEPLDGQYPASLWSADERVMDAKTVAVPAGTYEVFVGLYRWDTGERLPITGVASVDNRLSLGTVTVP